jgi:hypothetical protein
MKILKLARIYGQLSWRLTGSHVDAYITRLGGHLGPITFSVGGKKLQPMAIAPWAEESDTCRNLEPLLRALRGDFFCMPFGTNATPFNSERHPTHGETANEKWRLESDINEGPWHGLHLSMATRQRKGRVDKRIFLRDGHSAVYCRHTVSGMGGPMSPGHHAMLKFPDEPGCGLISTSPIRFGRTLPKPVELPENKGYASLRPNCVFRSIKKVPTVDGGLTDLSVYPARRGYEDLVQLANETKGVPFGWTAVSFPKQRFVWFALKDVRVLNSTILWISNGGRYYAPWNGRHVNVMGLEGVCTYFHYGVAESYRTNPLSKSGHRTHLKLDRHRPTAVNYIMGVAVTPRGFSRVASISSVPHRGRIVLKDVRGRSASSNVDTTFLFGAG